MPVKDGILRLLTHLTLVLYYPATLFLRLSVRFDHQSVAGLPFALLPVELPRIPQHQLLESTFSPGFYREWERSVSILPEELPNRFPSRIIQRARGYLLTGDTSQEYLFFLHGEGKNGKTTFINILSYILRAYHKRLRIESFLLQRHDRIPNDIAQLPGTRLLITTEVPERSRLNESLMKDLTGGDEMSARFLHEEFFSFYPVYKLWMFGNHSPRITGTDDGIWRRIRKIPLYMGRLLGPRFNSYLPKTCI
jgi:hypothetical protein